MGVHYNKDDLLQRKVHAFWLAVKACVLSLVYEIALQLATDLSHSPQSDWRTDFSWRPAHAFPWIVQGRSFRFYYVRAVGAGKMAFLVQVHDGDLMVVMFVNHTHYAIEAPKLLAQQHFAPQIFHMEVINDEWTMLIM